MKLFLLALGVCICSASLAQNGIQSGNQLFGKWKAMPDTAAAKGPIILNIEKDSITFHYEAAHFRSRYTAACATDSCILTLVDVTDSAMAKIVITGVDQHSFYFNTAEQHRRYVAAKYAKPGAIAWGWSDPRPIRFARQQELPR
jgi:hypothetical protein